MKAYVTSIGEPTTELCVWSLERNGFEVVLIKGTDSLASKLDAIYNIAKDDFVRVDADVIPNRSLTPEATQRMSRDVWWLQFMTFDWYKQDLTHGGVQLIRKEARPALREHVHEAFYLERPESYMFRLKEFHDPRRCLTSETVMGIHNYKNDVNRVKATKTRRNQIENYDFELAERMNAL